MGFSFFVKTLKMHFFFFPSKLVKRTFSCQGGKKLQKTLDFSLKIILAHKPFFPYLDEKKMITSLDQ